MIKELKPQSVNCIVTSPPYFNMRDYKNEPITFHDGWVGQLGQESTPEQFVSHLVNLFDIAKPVLKDDGTLWVNIGDSFGTNSGAMSSGITQNSTNKLSYEWLDTSIKKIKSNTVKHKCLCLVPQRFAISMVNHGWILRNTIVWHKCNHSPEPFEDRFTRSNEFVYFFTKKPKYYFDLDSIRVPNKIETLERYQRAVELGGFRVKGKYVDDTMGKPRTAPKWFLEGQNPESFSSPRARISRSKFLDTDQQTASPGARAMLSEINGKLTTTVRKKLQDIGTHLKNKLRLSGYDINELSEIIGIRETTLSHYFRTDLSGQAIPDRITWEAIDNIINIGNYDEYVSEEVRSALPTTNPKGKNPGDTWQINTKGYSGNHFAVFPEELIRMPIIAGCPEGGTVLEPFAGSGTVGIFCRTHNRNVILFEANPEYAKLIKEKCMSYIPELSTFYKQTE